MPSKKLIKPPLGIMPEWLWKEERVWDLIDCLARHRSHDSVSSEWFVELNKLLSDNTMKAYRKPENVL